MPVEWTVTSVSDVTLVTVQVQNPAPISRRVRVQNCLAGSVLPPRREGVPERGWDDDGYEGVVDGESTLTLGYACPAPVERPPVDVEWCGRADDATGDVTDDVAPDEAAATAIRRLGSAAPPADVLPTPSVNDEPSTPDVRPSAAQASDAPAADGGTKLSEDTTQSPAETTQSPAETTQSPADAALSSTATDSKAAAAEPSECSVRSSEAGVASDEPSSATEASSVTAPAATEDPSPPAESPPDSTNVPRAVQPWLEAVEDRLEQGEQLADATVAEATTTIEATGGLDAVTALPPRLRTDAETLRAVARRADRLAARAEDVADDVPVDALRRLA